ncbi:MAG: hypothetical protein RBR52_04845 [Thiomonas sp.]|uniref:hypothetical protein n=1 Tax=Thiomonas sp. TaxID=2047785 RepID=UPI002A35EDA7|nr:hypothetical protein [Thiomonas sp.]MDY0329806.1 hypothetical protein [Thiomonas sp.]
MPAPPEMRTQIASTALLGIIEQAGLGVLTLTENLGRDELLRTRLTRDEVGRQLRILTDSLAALPPDLQKAMPEIDWAGWQRVGVQLMAPRGETQEDALWFAVESLTPALLLWLRVYRRNQPELFKMRG